MYQDIPIQVYSCILPIRVPVLRLIIKHLKSCFAAESSSKIVIELVFIRDPV